MSQLILILAGVIIKWTVANDSKKPERRRLIAAALAVI